MKKNILFILISAAVYCIYGSLPVFAHTLKIDRAIGVTLHADPDDAPVAGKESKFYVEITDSSGRFDPANPSNCICTLTISSEGNALVTLPVVSGGAYAQLRYTFPKSGRYQVEVQGKPTGEGQLFQAFSSSFEYYVKGDIESSVVNPLALYIPYVQALCGAIIVWMFVFIKR